jgi:hypothetical protein
MEQKITNLQSDNDVGNKLEVLEDEPLQKRQKYDESLVFNI